MNTINATAAGLEAAFRSWVDAPTSEKLEARRIVIRGWCYHRPGKKIAAVRARLGLQVFPGLYGDKRPDVLAAFAGEARTELTGFEIAVTFPAAAAVCRLEARLDGEVAWQAFQSFRTEPSEGAADRGRGWWVRFWINAWAGRPKMWADLKRDDRDFLVAWARHRGWLNLQLAPQHEPRPITPERFPRSRKSAAQLPKITAVTPSFQHARFLAATMQSVVEQPGVRLDYIVQDGGSTDGSIELIRRLEGRLKHWASEPDQGQADAIVRGFRHLDCGRDDVMMYLNSDDLLMPGAARYVAEFFAKHPEVDVVYGHRVLIDEDGREVGRWFTPRQRCDDLRLHDLIPQETLFWRRRIWDRVGGIDPSFQFALDWDLVLRFAAAGARFARVPRFLGMFRLHVQQKSQAQLEAKGIPEMERLRLRTLGRPPTEEEMHLSMRRAQFDSALLRALWQRGVRA